MSGRPPKYNKKMLQKARDYLALCQDSDIPDEDGEGSHKAGIIVKVPTRGGMAAYLQVSRDTLYDWAKKFSEFSYIMERLGAEQEDRLINNGLSGTYNPTIAKVLLSKHGYREETKIEGEGFTPVPVIIKSKNGNTPKAQGN